MRLDKYLAERYFSSRTKAARALAEGNVLVNGKKAKASDDVKEGDDIRIRPRQVQFVSEGGYKLRKALDDFSESVVGVYADFGASTGGFTDCLLQAGAARVYAIDVGESQLASELAADARVVVMDRTNVRYLKRGDLPEPPDGVVIDVSFISLTHVLPAAAELLSEGGKVFALIKPQFECEGRGLDKHGIVKEEKTRLDAVGKIYDFARQLGLGMRRITNAPLREKKNVEYIALFVKGGAPAAPREEMLRAARALN